MAEAEHNLVLEHLRALRAEIGSLKEDMREIKLRQMSMESRLASIDTRLAHMHADDVSHVHRTDRIVERLERIEHRLDIYDSTTPPHN